MRGLACADVCWVQRVELYVVLRSSARRREVERVSVVT